MRRIMKLMKLIFPYPLPQYSLFRPFPRACQSTPKTKTTKESPLEPGHPQKRSVEDTLHVHDVMNEQGFPPPKKLFAAFLLRSFLEMPPFFKLHGESFFCIFSVSPEFATRTHSPAMSDIPKVRSFQVIALFFPNALELVPH